MDKPLFITNSNIELCFAPLNEGAIIAYPSDTIWGLGCHPQNRSALKAIAELKQRPKGKGFILLSNTLEWCLPYINETYHDLALNNIAIIADQPTTFLIPKSHYATDYLVGESDYIAIRITDKPLVRHICDALKQPLVSTSINISGQPSINNLDQIVETFGNQIDIYLDAEKGSGQASTILNLMTRLTIR